MLSADALVLASPVYKGSYCGLFKHLFDLLDPLSLAGKPVLLGATGGGPRHALVIEHQLRPLLGFFEAQTLATGIYAADRTSSTGLVASAPRLNGWTARSASSRRSSTPSRRDRRAASSYAPVPRPASIAEQRQHSGETTFMSEAPIKFAYWVPNVSGRPRDQQHRAAHRLGHRLQPQAGADRRGGRLRLCAEPDPLHRRLRRRQPARVGVVQPRAGGGDREADGDRGVAAGAVEPGAGGEADRDDQPPDRRPHRRQRGQRLVPRRVRGDRRALAGP